MMLLKGQCAVLPAPAAANNAAHHRWGGLAGIVARHTAAHPLPCTLCCCVLGHLWDHEGTIARQVTLVMNVNLWASGGAPVASACANEWWQPNHSSWARSSAQCPPTCPALPRLGLIMTTWVLMHTISWALGHFGPRVLLRSKELELMLAR